MTFIPHIIWMHMIPWRKKDITKIDLFSFYSNHFKKVEQVMVF